MPDTPCVCKRTLTVSSGWLTNTPAQPEQQQYKIKLIL